METQTNNNPSPIGQDRNPEFGRGERTGRIFLGLIIMTIGSIFLAKQSGVEVPGWLLSWPMILIVVGIFVGVKQRFKDWAWLILILIGGAFLAGRLIEGFNIGHYMWPVIIIAVGLIMIIRPKKKEWEHWRGRLDERRPITPEPYATAAQQAPRRNGEEYFELVNVFGGSKKVVISKDFRSGEVVTIFGGSDINFGQADMNGPATLELVQIFGGAKLIVPANWKIQTEELVCIFGGLDDKRSPSSLNTESDKVLILKGTCIFAGIDIRTY
ncbi:LiaF transmembrane domain-containing protein [Pseudochryseolinea flava]|uniref:LiaF transmembrane domain-containing protein n=1 Tax=Pseudochryseolinea flava TaxID=2059302 RepID=A0A364XXV5_9BACT|nr:DUF5668 domain-containing protein [Pseudochryseolinea flava]RAV99083.1 hypothetical protein DQQ10_21040 [Pseudochryseolinea flava]